MKPIPEKGLPSQDGCAKAQKAPTLQGLPPKGAWIDCQFPFTGEHGMAWRVQVFAPAWRNTGRTLVCCEDQDVFRLVQLSSGNWQPTAAAHGQKPPPLPALSKGLQLLDQDIRVWLHGDSSEPAVATVLAFSDKRKQHALVIDGAVQRVDLSAIKWEHLDAAAQQPDAAAGNAHTSAAASAQQRKRKQPLAAVRTTRAGFGQEEQSQQDSAPGHSTAPTAISHDTGKTAVQHLQPEAAAAAQAANGPAPQRRVRPWLVPSSTAAVAVASGCDRSVLDSQGAAKAAVGKTATAVSRAGAATLVSALAADDALKPVNGGSAVDLGSGRPQRSRQPSKRLSLPGEQHDEHQNHAASHHEQQQQQQQRQQQQQQPGCSRQGGTAPAGLRLGQSVAQEPAAAVWPSDEELLCAVAAAQVPHLAAGKGQLRWPASNNMGVKAMNVQLDGFSLGSPVTAHVGDRQVAAMRPQLFREVIKDGSSKGAWVQLSQPCHDCQEQHVPHTCRQPGCNPQMSICNRCLLAHYHTLFSLTELLERCPSCRAACACSSCLRNADHMALVPPLQNSWMQQQRQAQYVLNELVPHLRAFLQQQAAEAAAWGYASLQQVPASPLDVLVRPLCDRCATQVAGIVAHCPHCGWDVCCDCAADLRQHVAATATAATAAAAAAGPAGAAGPGGAQAVTCCNPECNTEGACQAAAEMLSGINPSRASAEGVQQGSSAGMTGQGPQHIQQQQEGLDAMDVADATGRDGEPDDAEHAEEGPAVVRGELFSLTDTPALEPQLVLPPDLLDSLGELQQLAQSYPVKQTPLQLQDCPLLSAEDLQLLHDRPPTAPTSSQPLTLQHLQSSSWWQELPGEVRDPWRRAAAVPRQLSPAQLCPLPNGPHSSQHGQPVQDEATAAGQAAEASGDGCVSGAEASQPASLNTAVAGPNDVLPGETGASTEGAAGGTVGSADGSSVYLFTPHVDDLQATGAVGLLARLVFWARWRLGEPIIVRGLKCAIPWAPSTLERAMGDDSGSTELQVLDCYNFSEVNTTQRAFFKGYVQGMLVERMKDDGSVQQEPVMYKLKDWPASADIRDKLCRHYADFLAALPVRSYTEPRLGASQLNVATALQPRDNPTDLGPKCYIAYGRVAEAEGEGDSVTKCHCDMTDAVNLLLDTAPGGDPDAQALELQLQEGDTAGRQQHVRCGDQQAQLPGYQGAGAIWDIWSRSALQPLDAYLAPEAARFTHRGQPVTAADDPVALYSPVLSQAFMLSQTHREAFLQHVQTQQQQQQQQGIQLWHFEQFQGEAVFIPGGCAHQVRNLKSCCKIAADLVSPENMGEALTQKARLRRADLCVPQPVDEGPSDRCCQEKLQSQLILLRGVLRAARTLC